MDTKDYLTVGGLLVLILGMVFKFILAVVSKMRNGKTSKRQTEAMARTRSLSSPDRNGEFQATLKGHDGRITQLETDRRDTWSSINDMKKEQKENSNVLSRIDERTKIMYESQGGREE